MKDKNFDKDSAFDRAHLKQIIKIATAELASGRVGTKWEDMHCDIDLCIECPSAALSLRTRRNRYFYDRGGAYRKQFTITFERPSGAKTEIHKMMSTLKGLAEYYFYGFSNGDFLDEFERERKRPKIIAWAIGRWDVLRQYIKDYRKSHDGAYPGFSSHYRSCRSDCLFLVIDWADCPREILVASSRNLELAWKKKVMVSRPLSIFDIVPVSKEPKIKRKYL